MQPYSDAHKVEVEEKERFAWLNGAYVRSAIMSSIGNAFIKKGQKPNEYPDSPVMSGDSKPEYDENGEMILTEEEKRKWRERLLMGLRIKQHNFETTKNEGGMVS